MDVQGDKLAVELAARGYVPTTKGEWLGLLAACALVGTTFVLVRIWAVRRKSKQLDVQEAQFAADSARFKARWPAQLLRQAPYAELEAEAERSWRVVFIMERRRDTARRRRRAEVDAQIAALRGWITTLVNAMNVVASRGRNPQEESR